MNVQGLIAVYEKLNKCSISRRRDDRFTRKLFYLEVKHGLYFLELFGRDFLKQMLGRACFMAMEISFRSI